MSLSATCYQEGNPECIFNPTKIDGQLAPADEMVMKLQTPALQYLAQNDLYFVAPFVPAESFVSFCGDREIQTSLEQFERFERGEFVAPLARFRSRFKIKVERTSEGLKNVGLLEEDESWTGETQEQTLAFWTSGVRRLHGQGYLLDPGCNTVDAWDRSKFTNLYSIFQCYPIWECLTRIRISGPTVDQLNEMTDQELGDTTARISKILRAGIPQFKSSLETSNNAALVCQAISNRYYPQTQTNQRTVTVPSIKFDWDWHEYRRLWDAKRVADELGLAPGEIFEMWRRVASEASSVDPLREWDDLIPFVSVDEKRRLRGKALLADSLRTMATMLAWFYEEVAGKPVPEEFSVRPSILSPNETANKTLRQLEYVANKYHLNPRPKLILVVEGESEAEQIPQLMALFCNLSPSTAGIEIVNLRSIDNFTGKKKLRGGALRRFIDDYHARQTIVYVLLDNEGRAENVKNELLEAQSTYFSQRRVTRNEYIHIWKWNYEFDNFTDLELAQALSAVAGCFQFTDHEIAARRQAFKDGDVLGKLFRSKTARDLPKRELGRALTDILIAEANSTKAVPQRPILLKLQSIIEAAMTNHQPTSGEAWEENQRSGYLGEKIP